MRLKRRPAARIFSRIISRSTTTHSSIPRRAPRRAADAPEGLRRSDRRHRGGPLACRGVLQAAGEPQSASPATLRLRTAMRTSRISSRSCARARSGSDMVIVITYDEFGGAWDQVAPPRGDLLGPGARIPAMVISPLAKHATVDHTPYDTGLGAAPDHSTLRPGELARYRPPRPRARRARRAAAGRSHQRARSGALRGCAARVDPRAGPPAAG